MSRAKSGPEIRELSDLTLDPRNANTGTARGAAALARSLEAYGPGRAVLVDRHGVVIAGNKTVAQARRLNVALRVVKTDGHHLVVVQRSDLDLRHDPKARELAIADNRVGELDLEWDVDMLKTLRADGLDLSSFWTESELSTLLGDSGGDGGADDAVVAPQDTDIVRGDLLILGNHRLLCGDATSATDVARLLDGAQPVLMSTDPPYGVGYTPSWRQKAYPGQGTAVGAIMNDHRADWTDAWRLFPGAVAYVWHGGLKAATVAASLDTADFALRSQIIWVKQHFAMSRGHYHWQHEPAWYAVRKGTKGHWYGDRSQSTVWEVPSLNPMGGGRSAENPATGHGTQKPVRLFEIPLLNHTRAGDAVYDPFVGSGTAIIAAEKQGRRCLAMDLDPRYVQATVTRWEDYTSRKATRQPAATRGRRRAR